MFHVKFKTVKSINIKQTIMIFNSKLVDDLLCHCKSTLNFRLSSDSYRPF